MTGEERAREPPQGSDLFYFSDLYVLATFIYLFPKGYFWRLLGLLCSKAPFSRISFPLLELQLSFVRPPGGAGQPLAISLRHPITP